MLIKNPLRFSSEMNESFSVRVICVSGYKVFLRFLFSVAWLRELAENKTKKSKFISRHFLLSSVSLRMSTKLFGGSVDKATITDVRLPLRSSALLDRCGLAAASMFILGTAQQPPSPHQLIA